MEITNEIKAKVFSQYLGQKITRGGIMSIDLLYACKNAAWNDYGDITLRLKPLSSITDEDAIEVAKIIRLFNLKIIVRDSNGCFLFICEELSSNSKRYDGFHAPKYNTNSIELLKGGRLVWDDNSGNDGVNSNSSEVSLQCYQYLISKGYDLPNFFLGGKTLKECELCIYEN